MLPKDIIRKIHRVHLKSKTGVDNVFSGNYKCRFKGQGIDFSELREYQAGDDVRLIDWKNTEKMNSPYIKVYEEERELTVILAVDVSASCLFASQKKSKKDLILELSATLGISTMKNNDI